MVLRRQRRALYICIFALTVTFLIFKAGFSHKDDQSLETSKSLYPLTWKHVHLSSGHGGSWYIPPDWIPQDSAQPKNILEAARMAAKSANSAPHSYLNHSTIPRIIHQTWKDTHLDGIPSGTLPGIERWLHYATDPTALGMAYFMWNDEGMMLLIDEMSVEIRKSYSDLPRVVEKADVFRIIVCNTIGGIYSDIDTIPLMSPSNWIQAIDIAPWTDLQTNKVYGAVDETTRPVRLVLGIEADTPEDSDSFWRMGYTFPVQLTQWTLASAINNGILNQFISDWCLQVQSIKEHKPHAESDSHLEMQNLEQTDPLTLTGPAAITKAAKVYLERQAGLRWQALSGLEDGGRSKLVQDALILPITGFSPGRGSYGNMGSKSIFDPAARVQHNAQGSWKTVNLVVEAGKLCRTFLGRCRDWSKTP